MNLKPDYFVKHLCDIDSKKLRNDGILLLICDVDNTLCLHDESEICQQHLDWIDSVKKEGIKVVLISNNHKKRIAKIGQTIGCDTIGFALKPMKHAYKEILRRYQVSTCEVFCVGDQLFTDIIGAKRMKMKCALVEPLAEKDIIYTRVYRWIEKLIVRKWRKE